ncbi:transporter [Bradyrhizobium sp. 27S5]|uniref:transporter n=1 Tax=Bradyrhizobium sp. 27S5 TaxID=3139728 RepID=UPI0030D47554
MNRHGVGVQLTVSDAPVVVDASSDAPEARVASRLSLCLAYGMIAALSVVSNAKAQEAEPRSYSNTPIGLNFLIAGYAYSQGKLAFDPNTAIADTTFRSDTGVLAYVRSFELAGQSAKLDVIVPTSSFAAHGLVNGEPRERETLGLGDPRFRFSVNLFGAPALSAKEFASYRQDLIVGVSMQVSAPVGQYDNAKLLNLGGNRWSFRPEFGISKAWGPWTVELAPSVTFFSNNTDFFGGNTFSQAPIYAVQGHVIYTFQSGVWMALDGLYFAGGRTALNGVKSDNEQAITRAGLTVALPINRQNSLKLSASTGITTRTGSELTAVAIAWQYRWGDGY